MNRSWISLVLMVLLVSSTFVGVAGGLAVQNNTTAAPYFANQSTQVDNESWMEGREEPTLDNSTHMLTRLSSFVIGEQRAQGGGWAGILITAIVTLGVMLGATFGADLGPIGGATLSVVAIRALVGAGLAPPWIMAVALVLLGIAATAALRRAFE